MKWYLIEYAYGECEIHGPFTTKRKALVYGGFENSNKLRQGEYEMEERHLVLRYDRMAINGYPTN